jgi:hypothetical protein
MAPSNLLGKLILGIEQFSLDQWKRVPNRRLAIVIALSHTMFRAGVLAGLVAIRF